MTTISGLLKTLSRPAAHADRHASRQATQITRVIDEALDSAGLHADRGPGVAIRATIDDALARAGLRTHQDGTSHATPGHATDDVIDAEIVAVDAPDTPALAAPASSSARTRTPAPETRDATGTFREHVHANANGTRTYKLYVPAALADPSHAPAPLILMLHGCTQSPDDFAVGTDMNALADAHGFLVAYPAQTARDNSSRCWNWFRTGDQSQGAGEPALLAGIVDEIASRHRVDPQRTYVAGLSAGAAMAVILGHVYPQKFAAIGVHSGLPYAAARDVASAFSAMQGRGSAQLAVKTSDVRTIIFHGDADHTVADSNAQAILQQLRAADAAAPVVSKGSAGGRNYTRETYLDPAGRSQAEFWHVHGAGHAWIGGNRQGTYTDPLGPDASAEMVRFFLDLADHSH